jgi:gamma-glutamyl-gamma-aminobutyrate hydrolase PuuD
MNKKKAFIAPVVLENKYKKYIFTVNQDWINFAKHIDINLSFDLSLSYKKISNLFDLLIICGEGDLFSFSKKKNDSVRESLEKNLINHFIKKKKPILAICRGMQLINHLYGGSIKKIKDNSHVRKNHIVFFKEKKINTNSYHNYKINKVSKEFNILGMTKDKTVEIIYNKKKNIFCTMFHPERKNIDQKKINTLIKKFINGNSNFSSW